MSATCRFCNRDFSNAQAVRAHLKSCEPYQNRPRQQSTNEPALRQPALGSSLAGSSLRDRQSSTLAASSAPASDPRFPNAPPDIAGPAPRRPAANLTNSSPLKPDATTGAGDRRAVIQQVKREVLDGLWRLRAGGNELRSELPAAIERAFADLPVQDMPHDELLAIAEGIRDKLYRNVDAAQKRAAQLLASRQTLIRDGHSYAVAQLKDVEGLKVFERWRIQNRIDERLKRLAGDETLEDVQDLIEDMLETEGIDWSDEDE